MNGTSPPPAGTTGRAGTTDQVIRQGIMTYAKTRHCTMGNAAQARLTG